MSAAARAEARRKAILGRGGDRLAKLTSSGRGEDHPVYVREQTPDPPLPTFPPASNLENFVGEESRTESPPRVRSRVPSRTTPNANANASPPQQNASNPFGMPDPSAWSMEQQAQFLQALMGGMPASQSQPALTSAAAAGQAEGNGAPNPFAGMPGMENNPLAAMMQMAAAGGGGGAFPPMGGDAAAAGPMGGFGAGMGMGKAPEVAPPKTLVQRLLPAVHLVSVWSLLMYFVLVMEPAAHGPGVDGVAEPGGIGFAWRWRQLMGSAKGQLGTAFASGWGVQVLPFFWAFVTLELVLHSLRIFSGFDAFRPPMLVALALPHLPPRISSVIVHGMKYMQMASMFLDDVAAVISISVFLRLIDDLFTTDKLTLCVFALQGIVFTLPAPPLAFMQQNRLGLGLRPPLPSYGQGPSISALAYQQQAQIQPQKQTTLFVGSISGGITDVTLNELLTACGPIKSFKRLITPANKPQGFGFAEFEEPDGALRALALLNNVELPALEDGCANKKLLIKADEKTRAFLDAYASTRPLDPGAAQTSKAAIDTIVADINRVAADTTSQKEKYVVPPHLHDLQEADLPETQRGLVISEIAQFRERAAKREREKMRELQAQIPQPVSTPSGPKMREWGRPKEEPQKQQQEQSAPREQGVGKGAQGYNKPVDFVRERERDRDQKRPTQTDEELEAERKESRRRDEEMSFRDRERRYEPRERARILALERAIARQRQTADSEARERVEMRARLEAWDDDESDELFYVDRARWRTVRARHLTAEQSADAASAAFEEEEEAANLARESEDFLARQMGEMQALAEEQRRAGLLLDDGAPVKLSVSLGQLAAQKDAQREKEGGREGVFGAEEDDEEETKKRKVPLVKLDFSAVEAGPEATRERLEGMKASLPTEREALFKAKVRWDGMTDSVIDRKFEPLVKRVMTQYLGDAEEAEELIMFVVEHLKDHKGPAKLTEGLEPVLEEEAVEVTTAVWRQLIFESMAYGEGLHTDRMFVD
ncbi:hypothetical protein MSAN_00817000 [Mycena sanguinolenta]|uniref:PWI domain-containing protein n=1 Tax=Mycena sanguinolenta TaxID=230812 RepID=A0A8H7D9S5_9AGAR|nr:hypothetical protein MSAN_00817000 [Mycena sanguinolenta]